MLKFDDFFGVLEKLAPLKLSEIATADGGYDNSGVIVKNSDNVNSVLFSLDLSVSSVEKAIELGVDTIVTHHPAIYYPIKNLSIDGENKALLMAIKQGLNVISMHLNLDVVCGGIDDCLSNGLGGEKSRMLETFDGVNGYGRENRINMDLLDFVAKVKTVLQTDKVLVYGQGKCEKMASFCGGGASHAINAIAKNLTDADLIITSDLAHHQIKEIVESGRKLVIIPHYASEQYGFEKFYERVINITKDKAQAHYFQDKRFM